MDEISNLLKETPETYYWIGFLMADGHFDKDRGSVALGISNKDIDHLKKFSKLINAKVLVGKNYSRVNRQDKIIVPKIIDKFNISNRKTYEPPVVNIDNDDLFLSFIIGFIDGDGCIDSRTQGIEITCHKSWGDNLNKWFARIWILSKCISNGKNKKPEVIMQKRLEGYSGRPAIYARIRTNNNTFCMFLKNKAIKMHLPILTRKWNRICDKYSRNKSDRLKNIIIDMSKSGMTGYAIYKSGKIDATMGYIYRVLRVDKSKNVVNNI